MPREARSPSPDKPLEELEEAATELAEKVASAIAAADPGGHRPEVRVLGTEVDELGLPVSGTIEIEIKYKTNTFKLSGTLPGSDPADAYEFTLTMKRDADANPFGTVGFTFKHKDNWSVTAGIGEMKVGTDLIIKKVEVSVIKEPTPPPNGPVANALPA